MGILNVFKGNADPVFVRNAEPWRMSAQDKAQYTTGAPRETEWYTQARLEAEGIVGLYAPARKGLLARVLG